MSDLKIELKTSGTLSTLKRDADTSPQTTMGEFERLDVLSRRLLNVPKKALDEKRGTS